MGWKVYELKLPKTPGSRETKKERERENQRERMGERE